MNIRLFTLFLLSSCWALANDINPVVDDSFNPGVEALEQQVQDSHSENIIRLDIDLETGSLEERVSRVLAAMTVEEKIGQLCQIAVFGDELPDNIANSIRAGRIGSLFYTGSMKQTEIAQKIAREESRLGLPLLIPRDVIHGFRTVFPIPIGQAASWNSDLVRKAAHVSAKEAKTVGVNWTFAPMIDISRDARWGRIAESVGEDPYLASVMAQAMIEGFQDRRHSEDGTLQFDGIAACAKHFAAYGLSEGGRDYNRAQVAISELHNVFLKPFHAAVLSDCLTFMTGFSSVNGTPATGNKDLIQNVLKQRWGFEGLVVSDWGSVTELIEHGFASDKIEAAYKALSAGVDMEMATSSYRSHVKDLLDSGRLSDDHLNQAVKRILRVKLLVANQIQSEDAIPSEMPKVFSDESLSLARDLARESVVLLKNQDEILPLAIDKCANIALIGPLADAGRDQLGCWMLDGRPEEAITVSKALQAAYGKEASITFVKGLESTISDDESGFNEAVSAAKAADVVIMCVGESYDLSGEARCRADLNLPGAQSNLIEAVVETNTPVVLVFLSGRPLTIGDEVESCDAALYAWHPGTMGGPAIVDLIFGKESPSGKLPVTFPKHVGQAPLYYNHPNTGRPALPETRALFGSGLTDFPEEQKYRSHYLDIDPFPLYPFGYGLTYTTFLYEDLEISTNKISEGQTLSVRVKLTNTGNRSGEEIAQLYVQDVTANLVRPVRELKAFRRVKLDAGESTILEFAINSNDLAYHDNRANLVLEKGVFRVGIGTDSTAPLLKEFTLVDSPIAMRNTEDRMDHPIE